MSGEKISAAAFILLFTRKNQMNGKMFSISMISKDLKIRFFFRV